MKIVKTMMTVMVAAVLYCGHVASATMEEIGTLYYKLCDIILSAIGKYWMSVNGAPGSVFYRIANATNIAPRLNKFLSTVPVNMLGCYFVASLLITASFLVFYSIPRIRKTKTIALPASMRTKI